MSSISDTEKFLQVVLGSDFGTRAIFAKGFPPGYGFRDVTKLDGNVDCFVSIAAFPDDGSGERTKARATEVRVLVVDDVTAATEWDVVAALGRFTAKVRTSPGNYQLWYRLDKPVPKDQWDAFYAEKMAGVPHDPGSEDAVHLFRVPMGTNNKPGRGGCSVELVEIDPGFELSVGDLTRFPAGPGPSSSSVAGGGDMSLDEMRKYLSKLPNVGIDRHEWQSIGHHIKAWCANDDEGFTAFDEWSEPEKYPGYNRECWDSFGASGLKTRGGGLKDKIEKSRAFMDDVFDDGEDLSIVAAAAGVLNFDVDQEKSSMVVVRHLGGKLRKVGRGDWREFDEATGRWREWTDDHMLRRVLELVNERKKKPMDAEVAKKLGSVKFIEGISRAASLHETVIARATDFDRVPLLLGVPSGVIDLGKGKSRAVRRGVASEMVSKAMWVDPAPLGTAHPEWSRFLSEFTQGDAALEEWLQVRAGYCLTGLMDEYIMPFYHGPGGNGKSVYLNALRSVWGEYGAQIEHRLLFEKQGGYHLAPLAVLAGVRLAIVTDVPQGASWDVHIMKMLTGDDAITANRMHQNPITFKSTAKVDVSGNGEPTVRDMDEGVRRRLKLIPLTAQPKTIDKTLSRKLAAEWPAILSWALVGLDMYWGLGGLPASKTVDDATRDYHNMLDPFQRWLDECVVKDPSPGAKLTPKELFQSWRAFRDGEGKYSAAPINEVRLSRMLRERGFTFGTTDGRSYLRGYKIVRSSAADVF